MTEKRRRTILLVDDDPVNIDYLRLFLDEHYNVQVASSGHEAIRLAADQPDLILLDIMMPDMDGYEVCKRLKSAPAISGIPIIFMTGLNSPEDEIKGLSLGAVDYFIKPMHSAITIARINTHLALRQYRDELHELNRLLKQQIRMNRLEDQ